MSLYVIGRSEPIGRLTCRDLWSEGRAVFPAGAPAQVRSLPEVFFLTANKYGE